MPSETVENYLKSILILSMESDRGEVSMGQIASTLGVTPGTATSMMKNLQKENPLVRVLLQDGLEIHLLLDQ